MRITNEEQLKKHIALKKPERIYFLFGNEPALLSLYSVRLQSSLRDICGDTDFFDGKSLSLPEFYEAAQLISIILGSRRLIVIADFDIEALSKSECDELCSFLDGLTEDVTVLIFAANDSVDLKKGKNSKKFLAAIDKNGVAAQLDRRSAADLRQLLRARCKKRGCELSNEMADLLTERCKNDMTMLINECDKLCAYSGGGEITEEMISKVCSGIITADIFSLARLMLKGSTDAVFIEIDKLISLREPVSLILANLGSAFCDLARAAAARSAGKSADELAAELSYKFKWRAQNAFRDSAGIDPAALFSICEIISDADTAIKSSGGDERILLETAVMRSMRLLQRGRG